MSKTKFQNQYLGFIAVFTLIIGCFIAGSSRVEAALNGPEDYAFDYIFYADNNPDLKEVYGYNESALRYHWNTWGIKEGRAGSPVYDGKYYLSNNSDLIKRYGKNNYAGAYSHFVAYGYKEKRASSKYYNGQYYASKNADLKNMSSVDLMSHYLLYGVYERRVAGTQIYYGDTANNLRASNSGKLQISGSQSVANGTYKIVSKLNGTSCIDISEANTSNGANAQLWAIANAQNQVFKLDYLGNGYYRIIATHSNKCLDINNGIITNNSNVKQWDWSDVLQQEWVIVNRGNGYYSIHSAKNTQYVLDISGGKTANGTNLQIYKYNGSNAQLFKFSSYVAGTTNSSTNNSTNWDSFVGKTVANINSKYYTSDNLSYVAGYKGQCTWYAFGRFYEVTGIKLKKARHAKYWLDDNSSDSRVSVTTTIKAKSIAVKTTGTYGHVMFIENVTYNANGTPAYVYFTECNADGNGVYNAGTDCIVKKLSYSNFVSTKKPKGYISAK